MSTHRLPYRGLAVLVLLCAARTSAADDDKSIELADGSLRLTAPADWVRKQPLTRIVEHEFAIPKAEGDEQDGRMTIMGAGGDIEANIARWQGQFVQADGGEAAGAAKVDKKKVAGLNVHIVDLSGTYKDQAGGPFSGAKVVERDNYRMLAAIIEAGELGNYFFKFYGPRKTVDAQEKAFLTMIESLKKK